jgi:DNA-binding transcriptional MerR regulator
MFSISNAAEKLGVKAWQVRRLYERSLLPPAARVGLYRVVAEEDMESVRAALVAAGYLASDVGKEVTHE